MKVARLPQLKNPVRALLFDLDGTLVDSLPHHLEAWLEAASFYGIEMNAEILYSTEGSSTATIIKGLEKTPGSSFDLERDGPGLVQRKEDNYLKMPSPEFMKGTRELLEELNRAGVLVGLVTGAYEVENRFASHPWFVPQFQAIVTAQHTSRGKPYPDPFLKGAELLGLPPNECLVVENAPLGLKAAAAAGCHAVGVLESSPLAPAVLEDAGAEHVFATLEELRAAITFGS